MTITQMKYFLKVSHTCNFSRAAEMLFVSQQALSKQIKALETELGAILFVRENKQITLTDAGRYLQGVWEPMMLMLDESLEKVKTFSGNKKIKIGLLELGEILDFLIPFNQAVLKENIEKEYVIDSTNKLLEQFQQKKLDILILFATDINIKNSNYNYRYLKRMPFGVVCNKQHPLAQKQTVALGDLANEVVCCFDTTYIKDMAKNVKQDFLHSDIPIKRIKTYNNWKSLEMGLRMNIGITMTYEAFMPKNSEHLVFLPLEDSENEERHYLMAVWHKDEWTELIDMIQDAFL